MFVTVDILYEDWGFVEKIKKRSVCMIPTYDADRAWRGSTITECEKEILTIEICVPDIWLVIVRGEIIRQKVVIACDSPRICDYWTKNCQCPPSYGVAVVQRSRPP